MPTISLCMIVKNEEQVLARCLDSVADLMDEIIIIDTGSTDGTKEIAARYTDKIYDFTWIGDFSAARNFSFSKATMDYIYAPDADEMLDEVNRERFRQLKSCLLPEIEIVQMWYVTEDENNTVMNVKREYRPKLFKRLRTFTWIDPVHETVRTEPVVFDSDVEILHKPMSMHGARDLEICARTFARDGKLSPRLQNMYAKELLKCGTVQEIDKAAPLFEKTWQEDPLSDAGKEAACVLARQARLANDGASLMKYALRDMLEKPCAEMCYELGQYYEVRKDYDEAIVWYQNAVYETSCILDVEAGGKRGLQGLVNCYEGLLDRMNRDASGEAGQEAGSEPDSRVQMKTACEAQLEHYKTELANWQMPDVF